MLGDFICSVEGVEVVSMTRCGLDLLNHHKGPISKLPVGTGFSEKKKKEKENVGLLMLHERGVCGSIHT